MKALIMLGSNMQDPIQQLDLAILKMQTLGKIVATSSLYKTAAWGNTNQNDFINQALILECNLPAEELMRALLDVELSMGRQRISKWAERSIDIDIIFYDNIIMNTDVLHVPHPHMQNRKFVLEPCAEIAGDWKHPILQSDIQELLKNCKDVLSVEKIS